MPEKPKIYSPEEANQMIPRFAEILPQLRAIRDRVVSVQNKCDIEEITSFGTTGRVAEEARQKMDQYRVDIQSFERDFERKLRLFEEAGCEIKSLEPGLVDFFSEKDSELVYLCWREGEDRISYWHTLGGGFSARQPLL